MVLHGIDGILRRDVPGGGRRSIAEDLVEPGLSALRGGGRGGDPEAGGGVGQFGQANELRQKEVAGDSGEGSAVAQFPEQGEQAAVEEPDIGGRHRSLVNRIAGQVGETGTGRGDEQTAGADGFNGLTDGTLEKVEAENANGGTHEAGETGARVSLRQGWRRAQPSR